MSKLAAVSFKKGRTREPRLSKPYVPGRHSKRYWTAADFKILDEWYPKGSAPAALARLPNKTLSGVYAKAQQRGLTAGKSEKIVPKAGFEVRLRKFYEEGNGDKRGECNAFADREKLPRWWVSKRARVLGLVIPHKKEPPWTACETELMKHVPLHDPDRCSEIFREHGFSRSPTAIVVRAKRLDLSRRFKEAMSASQVAKILGIDSKGVTSECIRGALEAGRRETQRTIQQGGDWWTIKPEALRRYILVNLERIDLRKVEKFAFLQIVAGEPLDAIAIPKGRRK